MDADKKPFSWRFVRYAWPAVLLPAAEVGFELYLWWRTGDPLATVHAESRGWGRGAAFPPALLWNTIQNQILAAHTLRYAVHVASRCCGSGCWSRSGSKRVSAGRVRDLHGGRRALPFLAGTVFGRPARDDGRSRCSGRWRSGRREGVDTAVKILFPSLMAALMFVAYA